jgi:hypothetical protein
VAYFKVSSQHIHEWTDRTTVRQLTSEERLEMRLPESEEEVTG